jgi:hypothetical protein
MSRSWRYLRTFSSRQCKPPFQSFLSRGPVAHSAASDVAVWAVMEPSLGIIAGCAATLRPLFTGWGFGPSSSSSSNRPTYGGSGPRSRGKWSISISRQRQKLGDDVDDPSTSSVTKPVSTRHGFTDESSEIELTGSRNSDVGEWDLEAQPTQQRPAQQRRHTQSYIPRPAVGPHPRHPSFSGGNIQVRTDIDVSSEQKWISASQESSERELPIQGERVSVLLPPRPAHMSL